MRWLDIIEHTQAGRMGVDDLTIDATYQFQGVYGNNSYYSKSASGYETWVVVDHLNRTLGYVKLAQRGSQYYNIVNMKVFVKGYVSSIVDVLTARGYKLISDDDMTHDGEKFFLKYANQDRLKTINMKTGTEEKWDNSMFNTDKDPRMDVNPIGTGRHDKHSVYWLIEEYTPKTVTKFGVRKISLCKELDLLIPLTETKLNRNLDISDY